jgi:gamma-glutamyl:cysteine ligase YbdK (ATP-grasp superfamily)
MGQEIRKTRFTKRDFACFHDRLRDETALLLGLIRDGGCSQAGPVAGVEIETWLVDARMNAAPVNAAFLKALADPLASPELAKFNVEFNTEPLMLRGDALSRLHDALDALWTRGRAVARQCGADLLMIGILPTLDESIMTVDNMSDLKRYRALNEQVLKLWGKPIELDVAGRQHLRSRHSNVMLESAATSFQLHIQTPLTMARAVFNASVIASAPLVAVSGNAPYLFGMDLWEETRIPLFEQSVAVGGYDGAAHGPVRRVSFGSGYVRKDIGECFEENLAHFPVLLPILFDTPPEKFAHLRLHNGTIWRWNRPLVGFDADGTPHIRIEHRVIPAGPSLVDSVANAAFYYGLVEWLRTDATQPVLAFAEARDNFYQAARFGLQAQTLWLDRKKQRMQALVCDTLLPGAEEGLRRLAIDDRDSRRYLGIIDARVRSGRTGADWQRRYMQRDGASFGAMTAAYHRHQQHDVPVHDWEID